MAGVSTSGTKPRTPAKAKGQVSKAAASGKPEVAKPTVEDQTKVEAATKATPTPPAPPPPPSPPTKVLVVDVIGPKKGRRRIGRVFGREPVRLVVDALTEDEQAALLSDSTLSLTTTEVSAEELTG